SEKSSVQSSERSSQGSHERKDSFYKTQKLINKINHEISVITPPSCTAEGRRKAKEANAIAPISPLDVVCQGPTAFVHRIELGRTTSITEEN
uniref:Uncharacterized protein n=1 Tax=Ascaris lumbricoides TaxID=6252 RepID=A0A0M3HY10_ASCLU